MLIIEKVFLSVGLRSWKSTVAGRKFVPSTNNKQGEWDLDERGASLSPRCPPSPHRILTRQKGVQGSEPAPDNFHPWICIYIIYLKQGINYPLEIAVRIAHFCGVIIRGG